MQFDDEPDATRHIAGLAPGSYHVDSLSLDERLRAHPATMTQAEVLRKDSAHNAYGGASSSPHGR